MSGISPTFEQPGTPRNNYTYNGKEHHADFNLGWIDYGARWYDPQVGRWWSVDPLAHLDASVSSYAYVANNPIEYTDPDGRYKTRKRAQKMRMGGKPRRPQGQWGSLEDLSYAGRMAGSLKPGRSGLFQLPPKHSSIVHPINGGDPIKANSMWLRNNGNIQGTFHGYPKFTEYKKRPIKD